MQSEQGNILRPVLDFLKGKSLLLIGHHLLTSFLERSSVIVTVFEPDSIHGRYPPELFDIVLLEEHLSLLEAATQWLKPDGQIILAVKNKLGLAVLANSEINTDGDLHGRAEWTAILSNAGFPHIQFFYPYPNAEQPAVILTERAFHEHALNIHDLLYAFFQPEPFNTFHQNGLTAAVSGWFLITAGRTNLLPVNPDILGWTFSLGRSELFSKTNIFLSGAETIRVIKEKTNGSPDARAGLLKQVLTPEPYIPGTLYSLKLADIVSRLNWSLQDLAQWFKPYIEFLFEHTECSDGLMSGQWIDATPFNMVEKSSGGYAFIDQEWQVDDLLPAEFVAFRGLYYTLARTPVIQKPVSQTPVTAFEICKRLLAPYFPEASHLTKTFQQLENKYFGDDASGQDYTPSDFQLTIRHPEDKLSFSRIESLQALGSVNTKIFSRTVTEGFSEQRVSNRQSLVEKEGSDISMVVENSPRVLGVRIDPAEQRGILKCHFITIRDEQNRLLASWSPADPGTATFKDMLVLESDEQSSYLVLLTDDPMIIVDLDSTGTGNKLFVSMRFSQVDKQELPAMGKRINALLVAAALETTISGKHLPELVHDLKSNADGALVAAVQEKHRQLDALQYHFDRLNASASDMSHTIRHLQQENRVFDGLKGEVELLRQHRDWYRRTYEDRSLTGIMKNKFKAAAFKKYQGMIQWIMNRPAVRKKYVLSYILAFSQREGVSRSIQTARHLLKENGYSLSKLRGVAVRKISSPTPARLLNSTAPDLPMSPQHVADKIQAFGHQPLISVIMPVYNPALAELDSAIESVRAQSYTNWELCIVDDHSTLAEIKIFLQSLRHPRIRVCLLSENKGISAASNAAVDMASGAYVALFDHDDLLTRDALFWMVEAINRHPEADILYSDECKIDATGKLFDYLYKPDWSPELLLNMMYSGHLTLYRKAFADTVGWFRSEYDFSQDYDLMLRASEQTDRIFHVPRVLYYWRLTPGSATAGDKPYARHSNIAALQNAADRRNWQATAVALLLANRVVFAPQQAVRVSIVIPTDSFENLSLALKSLLESTHYPDYEILVVTNPNTAHLGRTSFPDHRIRFVEYSRPYNFSDKCNEGVGAANGEIVIIFNDDVRPDQDDWIESLIEYLAIEGVGAVSPKLLYEDGSIQYAGMATGLRNLTGTMFHTYQRDDLRYFHFAQLVRDVSIVSGACLAIRKSLYLDIGGFDSVNTPIHHSDVDLSFKIREQGLRCVYTPYSTLFHIGHASLKAVDKQAAVTHKNKADIYLLKRWARYIGNDPYFTIPMRDALYHDSPEPVSWFMPSNTIPSGNRGDALLICHDLSLSGAPIMLLGIARALIAQGYFLVVACAQDGPLRKTYEAEGIIVYTDPLVLETHDSFRRFAVHFDLLICNTIVTWPVVRQMQHLMKTIWWIQEGRVIENFLMQDGLIETIRNSKNIIGVSDYALSWIAPYQRKYTKIYNASPDLLQDMDRAMSPDIPLLFSIVGTIEYRKGHDLLLHAMKMIPGHLQSRFEVMIVGRMPDPHFLERLGMLPVNVRLVGELGHDACLEQMKASDVIISASRDDPFPIVLVEALSLGKAVIVSTNTGLSELIVQGKNGLSFENEHAEHLAQQMVLLIENFALVREIGAAARETYLQFLTMPEFEKRLMKFIAGLEEPEKPKKLLPA